MEYYSAIKNDEILPYGMTPKGIMLRETSDRQRQMPYEFTYMWNLKMK